LYRLQQAPHA
jgi:hypothetical protein